MKKFVSIALATTALLVGVSNYASAAPGDTLKTVKARGALNCSASDGNFPGFFELDSKGKWHGLDIDYCRAVAIAIFGSDDHLTLVPISWAQRFPSLQSGVIDLVIKTTAWTMSRDTELNVQFSRPYFVGTTSFMARKDLGATKISDLVGGTVCTAGGTSVARSVSDYLAQHKVDVKLVTYEKNDEVLAAYNSGRCDSYAEWAPVLAAARAASDNPDGHVILEDVLALEPESVAMRQGDDQWVDVVNWVITALQIAEENGVDSKNVDQMKANPPNSVVATLLGKTPGVGTRLGLKDDWAYNVIKNVGNAEEVYERSLGSGSRFKLERGPNAPWQKGGLAYPLILD